MTLLGNSDLDITRLGFGTWAIGGPGWVSGWGEQDDDESVRAIHRALEHGIKWIDTAAAYGLGHAEEVVRRALDEWGGERPYVFTKCGLEWDEKGDVKRVISRERIRRECEDSLRRLNVDVIDLYQIHWPNREVPLEDSVGALEELKQAGSIRAIGVSNFGIEDLSDFLELAHPESNQLPYNLLWRAIEHELVPACLENDVGVLTYSSLMQGLLTGKFKSADEVPDGRSRSRHFSNSRPLSRHDEEGFEEETFAVIRQLTAIADEAGSTLAQLAIAWLLTRPAVTSVLVGAKTPSQFTSNVEAAELDVPDWVMQKMTDVTNDLKGKLGPNPDMWQSESRFR